MNLSFDTTAAPSFFLGIWDFSAQAYVERSFSQASPVEGEYFVKGLFALVVIAIAGEADYVLTIEVEKAPSQIPEREPNENFYSGRFIGEVLPEDRVVVKGNGDAAKDFFDSLRVPRALEPGNDTPPSVPSPLKLPYDRPLESSDDSQHRPAGPLLRESAVTD